MTGAQSGGLRAAWDRLTQEPNAIWMREVRQAARLSRTPWILFALTLSVSLLMCAIGGIAASNDTTPATIGQSLFQTFFSIAYFVVMLVGPAIAANSIASEREGRTWEAVLLTGLSPKQITRGKFFAAYTTIALYIVILAPVGALSFLFGGVTATEVVVGFVFLFLFAGLSVAFGLCVSSLMTSLRAALVVTLILAVCVGGALYSIFGFLCGLGVHEIWSEVPQGLPIWLPLAYVRAPFGPEYLALLFGLPLLLMILPAWFSYEATVANLTGDGEDRSTGLKRWYTIATPLFAGACAVPCFFGTDTDSRMALCLCGVGAFALYACFCAMVFASEPPGPSRRVRVHWERDKVGAFRRFFGPGLGRTSALVALLGAFGVAGISFAGIYAIDGTLGRGRWVSTSNDVAWQRVLLFGIYTMLFFLFVVGLSSWLRSRQSAPWIARLIALAVLFLIHAVPWVIAAIGGVLSSGHDEDWLLVASPSPFYVFVMLKAVDRSDPQLPLAVGIACALVWGVIGIVLMGAASSRSRRVVAEYDRAMEQADAALRAEDEAAARALSAPAGQA